MTQVVSEIGLRAAWSLDLTTVDPVDGQLWDTSLQVKQKRAVQLLERDKPLLLVAWPMCGPFGALQNLTYAKLSKKEVKAELRDAMAHGVPAPVPRGEILCLRASHVSLLEGHCHAQARDAA